MTRIELLVGTSKWCKIATEVVRAYFERDCVRVTEVKPQTQLDNLGVTRCDLMISVLCPLVLPQMLLDTADLAVNFHSGSRHYPGHGCYNFALYEGAKEYGAVCHKMIAKVDSGPILIEENFPISPNETVETLQLKSYVTLVGIVQRFCIAYLAGSRFDQFQPITWTRAPFTRKQLNALATFNGSMTPEEVERRKRAISYPGWPPVLELNGCRFRLETVGTEPLVDRILR